MRSRLKSPIDGVRVLAVNPGPVETEKHVNDTRRLAKEKFGDENRWREVMAGLPMNAAANDHRHLAADQIGGEARQLIPLIVRPSLLDNDVASFDKPLPRSGRSTDCQSPLLSRYRPSFAALG